MAKSKVVLAYQLSCLEDDMPLIKSILVHHSAQKSAIIKPANSIQFTPCVKICPTYAVAYHRRISGSSYNNSILPMLNKHHGSVSDKAATRIRNAVNWMLYFTSKKKVYSIRERSTFWFYLNFITLTLPSKQIHSDDYIKDKMLVPFLEWLCRTKGASMWLWKAESQSNGNIHFHITSHIFIHWKVVRHKWNQICNKHEYKKVYQDGSLDIGKSATQVKAAKNAEQVGGYLASYISKNDLVKLKIKKPLGLPTIIKSSTFSDTALNYCYALHSVLKRPIEGRLWACSTNLSNVNLQMLGEDSGVAVYDLYNELSVLSTLIKKEDYFHVLLYRHLKFSKMPPICSRLLSDLKTKMNLREDTNITVESLFE